MTGNLSHDGHTARAASMNNGVNLYPAISRDVVHRDAPFG